MDISTLENELKKTEDKSWTKPLPSRQNNPKNEHVKKQSRLEVNLEYPITKRELLKAEIARGDVELEKIRLRREAIDAEIKRRTEETQG